MQAPGSYAQTRPRPKPHGTPGNAGSGSAEGRPLPTPQGSQAGLGLRRPQTPAHSKRPGTNGPPLWGTTRTGGQLRKTHCGGAAASSRLLLNVRLLSDPQSRTICLFWETLSPSRGLTRKSSPTFRQWLLKANGFDFVLKSGWSFRAQEGTSLCEGQRLSTASCGNLL